LVSVNSNYNHVDLYDDDVFLGRQKKVCNIVLTDQRVSGKHCHVFRIPDTSTRIGGAGDNEQQHKQQQRYLFFIEDLSSNGTFHNEKRVCAEPNRRGTSTMRG
jgi:pSer/pThr/pTyr-binding forkhead associated (FHA) protein